MARRNRQRPAALRLYGAAPPDRRRLIILALFFLSGACGLVYEIVWMRRLTLVFGATTPATSTILAAFFTGMALGSFGFGRAIDRGWNPLRTYALLEAGIAACALGVPLLLAGLDDVYAAVHRRYDLPPVLLTALRFALSFPVLLLPATLMGGTLPVLVKYLVRLHHRLARNVGLLYALNTAGAVVGTVATGFFLILLLGARGATWLAGALNLLIAAVALLLARYPEPLPVALPAAPDIERAEAAHADSRRARLALWTAAVSGFSGLALEVLWTRTLVFFLDNSTHAFTTILTAFLIGIAIGGFVIAVMGARAQLVLWLAAVQVLIGVFAVLAMPILDHSAPVIQRLAGSAVDELLPWRWMGMRFLTSLSVMIVPTLLMGMTLPLAVQLFTRSVREAGRAVGSIYAANTLAGVAGSLTAGFLLIPLVGIHTSIILVAALNLAMGVVLLAHAATGTPRRWTLALAAVASFTVVAAFSRADGAPLESYYERMESREVLSYDEGVGATVKVFRDAHGDKYLSIDGFPVAGTSLGMQDAQKTLAHVPMLLTPVDSPRVNIIGFGSGGTSAGILSYGVTKIDCVELVPSVVATAKWFPEMNRSVLDEPAFTLIHGDGRNHALLSNAVYDVISIDATSPKMAGNGSLYALEFYRLLRARLSPDGLLVQWLPFHLLSDAETRMTMRTFQTVFPHTTLWLSPLRHHGVLVGTMRPLRIDVTTLRRKLERAATREELAPLHTAALLDFLSWFVMGPESLAKHAADARLNTDDRPYLEFTPALAFFAARHYQLQNLARFQEARESVLPLLSNTGNSAAERDSLARQVDRRFMATQFAIRGDVLYYLGRRAEAREEYRRAMLADPESRGWLNATRMF